MEFKKTLKYLTHFSSDMGGCGAMEIDTMTIMVFLQAVALPSRILIHLQLPLLCNRIVASPLIFHFPHAEIGSYLMWGDGVPFCYA